MCAPSPTRRSTPSPRRWAASRPDYRIGPAVSAVGEEADRAVGLPLPDREVLRRTGVSVRCRDHRLTHRPSHAAVIRRAGRHRMPRPGGGCTHHLADGLRSLDQDPAARKHVGIGCGPALEGDAGAAVTRQAREGEIGGHEWRDLARRLERRQFRRQAGSGGCRAIGGEVGEHHRRRGASDCPPGSRCQVAI